MENLRPKVGVWVAIRKNWKVLLGKRKNAHWEWYRAFPWGHLEFNEQVEGCAIREVEEETWIKVKNLKIWWGFTNDFFEKENKHYITLYVVCDHDEWEVKIMEPHKCEKRERFERENLPSPLFVPFWNLKKQNFHPYKSV